ncbi:MAG: hypothetical protein OSB58_11420 [Alphaproteobacteria bacterium]|nr:hypothetical protein [Alphaproteobacteria bacterium]
MKTTATATIATIIAAAVATTALTATLSPWQLAHAKGGTGGGTAGGAASDTVGGGDYQYGQQLYSLGDYIGALGIWQPLAEQGDARAQYSMAILYLKGRGIVADKAKARVWAGKAADQGYRPGQKLLQSMQRKIPAKEKFTQQPRKSAKVRKPLSAMTEMERVEAAVEDLLQQIAGKIANDDSLEYGRLRAVQLPDAIEITIPDLVITAADGGVFALGTVAAHVRRLDDRFDNITLALPGTLRFRQPFEGAWGKITIARRLATIRWDRELETSTDFEFRFGDLVFLLDEGGEMGRIDEVLVQADVRAEARAEVGAEAGDTDELWTGTMRFALDGAQFTSLNGATMTLDRVDLVLDLRGLDIAAFTNQPVADTDTNTDMGTRLTLKDILGLAGGIGLRTTVRNLVLNHPSQGNFSLASAGYGIDLSAPDGRMLKLSLTLRHHDLVGTGSAAPEALVPRDLDIALVLGNIPSETVLSVGVAAVIEVALLGQLSAPEETFRRLRNELSVAGTVLQLKHANIKAQDYDIALAFTLSAHKTAKAGFLGMGSLRIQGLEKLQALAGHQAGGPVDGLVAAILNNGKPVDGGKDRLFDLNVRADGQLTVNNDPVLSLAPFDNQAN